MAGSYAPSVASGCLCGFGFSLTCVRPLCVARLSVRPFVGRPDLNIPRYKVVLQSVIGEVKGQGAYIASRCLWDTETDNYSSFSMKNVSRHADERGQNHSDGVQFRARTIPTLADHHVALVAL